ncbi:MAG: nucleotide exchange factor GrpE [Proteobacteria bacterium]|nr:nucleotide exchange factor GrpE [Pseudomonadota bacterium]
MRMNKMNEETPKKEVENEEIIVENDESTQAESANIEEVSEVEVESEGVASDVADKQQEHAQEIAALKEEIMRMRAETDNVRKRNARELEHLRKYSLDKFSKALIPVADSMDKELEANAKDGIQMTVEQMVEGTIMTQKVLLKVLVDHGVEVINPEGEKFNPEFHEAMTQIPTPDLPPNTIVDVFQKGYILNGRLIRPAMVVVSK